MAVTKNDKFFLCYLPGADTRRITEEHTPYLAKQLQNFPWMPIRSLPSSELLSTTITGACPHGHGIWQTRFIAEPKVSAIHRLFEKCPDFFTTTVQCTMHLLTKKYDLGTIPPRRRKHLDLTRIKFHGRAYTGDLLGKLRKAGRKECIVTEIGLDACDYAFTDRFNDRAWAVERFCSGAHRLEILQFHALDILGHWHMDTERKFRHFYQAMDAFLKQLHEKCIANGITMIVMSDHGQERIRKTLDIKKRLRALDVPESEYDYFMQAVMTRFWFHTDRARSVITEMLAGMGDGTLLTNKDLYPYGIKFPDTAYGEAYFILDPGCLAFPDDFYHPLVNFYFGLKDWQKRGRLLSGKQLGYHGYLPHHPSEKGFMVVLDRDAKPTAGEMDLIDVAPSIMGLLGYDTPPSMDGACRYRRR